MNEEIERVRKADERRGRRPVDLDAIAERKRQEAAMKILLQHGELEDLEDAMHAYGILPASPQWTECVLIWKRFRGARGRG